MRRLLATCRERENAICVLTREKSKKEEIGGYIIPGSGLTNDGKIDKQKKLDLLTKRYIDEGKHVTEQELWE